MGFQHPHQLDHMMRGVEAAMGSSRTPAHLKPHLAKRLGGTMPADLNMKPKRGSSGINTPAPRGVGSPGAISMPKPRGVPGPGSISMPKPRGVGSPGSISMPRPRGVGSPGSIQTARPRGVSTSAPVRSKQGSVGNANGRGDVKSYAPTPPTQQTMTWGRNDQMSPGEQEPDNLRRRPNFMRTQKLKTVPTGFKQSPNLKPKPNALYGEFD